MALAAAAETTVSISLRSKDSVGKSWSSLRRGLGPGERGVPDASLASRLRLARRADAVGERRRGVRVSPNVFGGLSSTFHGALVVVDVDESGSVGSVVD